MIVAMLAWYDEPLELLDRCVGSVEPFVDKILAVDGRYELTPGETINSPEEQYHVIEQAGGDKVEFRSLDRLWRGQVEKRTYMLTEGKALGADWLAVVDSDWVYSGNPRQFREVLDAWLTSNVEQFEVWFRELPAPPDVDLSQFHEWHQQYADITCPIPLIFRAMADMKVVNNHWTYLATRKDGTVVGLWGGDAVATAGVKEMLPAEFMIEHSCLHRDQEHIKRNLDLCAAVAKVVEQTGKEPI